MLVGGGGGCGEHVEGDVAVGECCAEFAHPCSQGVEFCGDGVHVDRWLALRGVDGGSELLVGEHGDDLFIDGGLNAGSDREDSAAAG